MSQGLRFSTVAAIAAMAISIQTGMCVAQFDDVNNGVNNQNDEASTFEQPSGTQPAGGFANEAPVNIGEGIRSGSNDAGLADLFDAINVEQEIPAAVDERRQGFIGVTGDMLGRAVDPAIDPTGFIGRTSENVAGSFGGGDTGGGDTGGGRQPTQQDQGQGTGENGFTVIRRNLRTRVRPSFATRPVSDQFISTRFQSRLQRLPSMNTYGQNVRVQVQNRTAVISGFVGSLEEADRIERQLRLEPGVYRIVNELSVGNASNQALPLQARR